MRGALCRHGGYADSTPPAPLVRVPTLRGRPRNVLDDRERALLEHVRRTGRIRNSEARDLVGVTDVFAMRRILSRLVNLGLLSERATAKKLMHYERGPESR